MGAADVVPGVSGATVALLLGIYDRLLAQIAILGDAAALVLRVRVRQGLGAAARADWAFLGATAAGIAIAALALARLVQTAIAEQPTVLSAAFFGLVVVAAVTVLREVSRWRAGLAALAAVVGVAVFALLGVRASSIGAPSAAVIVGAAALASCAMILPGISGAFVLLILGLYDPVIEAVAERDLRVLSWLALGAAIGLGAFGGLLHRLAQRQRDAVLAVLAGLMAGSLRVLWPWPAGAAGHESFASAALGLPAASEIAPAVIAAVAAAAAAAAMHRFAGASPRR